MRQTKIFDKACARDISSQDANRSKLKKDVEKFGSETSMHGIKYVCTPESTIITRLIWFTVIILMASGFTANFTSSLLQYYKYNSIISTRVDANQEMQLPAVTFCNNNLLKLSKISQVHQLYQASLALSMVFSGINVTGNGADDDFGVLKSITVLEALHNFGFNISEIFVECRLGTTVLDCLRYVSIIYNDIGLCYTFQSDQYVQENGPLRTKTPGRKHGLSFVLDVNPDEYILTTSLGVGFMVIAHNTSTYPIAEIKAFMISPGKEFYVSMKHNVVRHLPKPYSLDDCIHTESLHEVSNKSYGRLYSKEGCRAKCITEKIFNCHCDMFTPGPNSCSVYQYFSCSSQKVLNYLESGQLCGCLDTCQVNDFDIQISSTDFPNFYGQQYSQMHNWPITDNEGIHKRYVRLNVYYETLTSTITEQIPAMNLIELLGNIGGQLGLFLGASLITVLEILCFLVSFILKNCFAGKDPSIAPKNTNKITVQPPKN